MPKMQYRTFGKLNWKPSALGFGTMRLPVINNNSARIDEKQAREMIYYAIDHGVNYVDTAYPYHKGESELFLGKILKGSYREKVKIASKLPVVLVNEGNDFDRFLNEQLRKLQTDHIDFYLFHALNKERWEKIEKFDVLSYAEKALRNGKIGYLGFSFHDDYEVFKKIVDAYDKWAFCQIQYNFLDVNFQAGVKGLKYAVSKDLGVVIMEPLKGGKLANPPLSVRKLWDTANNKRAAVDWALQWVWNQPDVSLLLSGMSTLEQVKENVASAAKSKPNFLRQEELDLIDQVRKKYTDLIPVPCTQCEYCLPCSQGVKIPKIFELYNDTYAFNTLLSARKDYEKLEKEEKASSCVECGSCELLCPQKIEIRKWLRKADELLGKI